MDGAGRPFLPRSTPGVEGLDFSLSRAGGAAACAMGCWNPVGVDIERLERLPDLPELAEAVLTAREREAFAALPPSRRRRAFHLLWVSKEAVLKLEGSGLGIHPATFEAGPGCWEEESFSVQLGNRRSFVRIFAIGNDHVAAVASQAPADAVLTRFAGPLPGRPG